MNAELLGLLWCPIDHGDLKAAGDEIVCDSCRATYPVSNGVVRLLRDDDLTDVDRSEQRHRDEETEFYDSIFGGYPDAVEVPTTVSRIERPDGPILDLAAGSGRITEALQGLGRPVLAIDYSLGMLHALTRRCPGESVLAVQADARRLPVRDGVIHAVTCAEMYEHLRRDDRKMVLAELERVMRPGSPLSMSTFNYNLLYRVWSLLGNSSAREGEHLFGGDFYFLRMRRSEVREEFERHFDIEEIAGIRNIPARAVSRMVAKMAGERSGDRFLDWMTRRGYKIDWAIETTPLSYLTGFFWIVKARKRQPPR